MSSANNPSKLSLSLWLHGEHAGLVILGSRVQFPAWVWNTFLSYLCSVQPHFQVKSCKSTENSNSNNEVTIRHLQGFCSWRKNKSEAHAPNFYFERQRTLANDELQPALCPSIR